MFILSCQAVLISLKWILKVDANIIFLQYDARVWNLYPMLVADARAVGAIAARWFYEGIIIIFHFQKYLEPIFISLYCVFRFLQQLIDLTSLEVDKIHIIGFCLGAHVAGYIGKRIPNVYRITGTRLYHQDQFAASEWRRNDLGNTCIRVCRFRARQSFLRNGGPKIPVIGLGRNSRRCVAHEYEFLGLRM